MSITIFDKHFPLGLGTSRFSISGPDDAHGIERAVEIVVAALDSGVDYIDTSYMYSAGMAQTVLREAFKATKKLPAVTVKSQYGMDRTRDDSLGRVEMQLNAMDITHAAYFVVWTIRNFDEFECIVKKGGIYDAALKLKDEGVVDHICFSTHAPLQDTIRILESGMFEGMTISYSLLNGTTVTPALDAAERLNIGVAVMNPLGGGVIPNNNQTFSFAQAPGDSNVVESALRYAHAHPAIKVVLSGAASLNELKENLNAFALPGVEANVARTRRVNASMKTLEAFCTGCHYCDGCPVGIPTAAFMQARNTLLFEPSNTFKRTDPEVMKNTDLFMSLFRDFQVQIGSQGNVLDLHKNPCIHCGKCSQNCTQRLNIPDAVEDLFQRANQSCYTLPAVRKRFEALFGGMKLQRVGIIPSGRYARIFIELYQALFDEFPFEIIAFNNDPKTWGTEFCGVTVQKPGDIPKLSLDLLLVTNYMYGETIYNDLRQYETITKIRRIYGANDVPWSY